MSGAANSYRLTHAKEGWLIGKMLQLPYIQQLSTLAWIVCRPNLKQMPMPGAKSSKGTKDSSIKRKGIPGQIYSFSMRKDQGTKQTKKANKKTSRNIARSESISWAVTNKNPLCRNLAEVPNKLKKTTKLLYGSLARSEHLVDWKKQNKSPL